MIATSHPATRRAWLATEARRVLADEPGQISTRALVERIYPESHAQGEAITRRAILFKDMLYLAGHQLLAYASPGTPKKIMGHIAVPKVWHRPTPGLEVQVTGAKPIAPQRYALVDEEMLFDPQGEWVRWEDVKGLFDDKP